jgi:hypothetical protein
MVSFLAMLGMLMNSYEAGMTGGFSLRIRAAR